MSDPRTFALARLGEEETQAKAERHYDPDEGGYYACPVAQAAMFGKPADEESDGACTCGLEQRRERALMRVAALRALVDLHRPRWAAWMERDALEALDDLNDVERADLRLESSASTSFDRIPFLACLICADSAPCPSLRHVVAIWAWHEDYDESWKL